MIAAFGVSLVRRIAAIWAFAVKIGIGDSERFRPGRGGGNAWRLPRRMLSFATGMVPMAF